MKRSSTWRKLRRHDTSRIACILYESGDHDDLMYTNVLRLMSHAELENCTAGLTDELHDLRTCICCRGYKQAQSKLHDILQLFEYSLVIPEENRSGPESNQLEAILSEIRSGIRTTRCHLRTEATLKLAMIGGLKVYRCVHSCGTFIERVFLRVASLRSRMRFLESKCLPLVYYP
jgi:hypothetical protein